MVPGSKTGRRRRQEVRRRHVRSLNDTPADGLKQITVNVSWNDPLGAKNVAVHTIYTEVQR